MTHTPAPAERIELPDDIRVPLHEVIADLYYAFSRVAKEGHDVGLMLAASMRAKLEAAEAATIAALAQPRPVVPEELEWLYERLAATGFDASETWDKVTFSRIKTGLINWFSKLEASPNPPTDRDPVSMGALHDGEKDRHPDFNPGFDVSPFGVTPKEIVAWLRDGTKDVRVQAADLIDNLCEEIAALEGAQPAPAQAVAGTEALREALAEAKAWHEQQDKVLSKSGRNATDYHWLRHSHRTQIELIEAALSSTPGRPEGGTP